MLYIVIQLVTVILYKKYVLCEKLTIVLVLLVLQNPEVAHGISYCVAVT